MLVMIIQGSDDGLLTYVNRVDTIVRVVLNRSSESKTDVVALQIGGIFVGCRADDSRGALASKG